MGYIILLVLFLAGIIHFYQSFFGTERWCENCNRWSVMKLSGEWFLCKNCAWKNFSTGGCPKCGWYGKFENRFIRKIGPVVEQLFFQSIIYDREWWSCPKHGEYEIRNPLLGQQNYAEYQAYQQYDDYDNDQGYEEPDYGSERDDHWGPV